MPILDKYLVDYCSPTLAGLKTGSLIPFEMKDPDLSMEVRRLNRSLKDKGIRLIPIKRKDRKALLYLYRPARLKEDLLSAEAGSILREKGYPVGNPDVCVSTLVRHLSGDEEFPHEVGLFLGYPPSDVKCFMADSRKGVQCVGYWKAYGNVSEAERTFNRFRKCTSVYRKLMEEGKSLEQLTVKEHRVKMGVAASA